MRRFSYECECGHQWDIFLGTGERVPVKKRCGACGRMGSRRFRFPASYPDMPEKALSTLLPLNYTHATRGQVDRVEGHAALREHLKRYNGTYQTGLEMP